MKVFVSRRLIEPIRIAGVAAIAFCSNLAPAQTPFDAQERSRTSLPKPMPERLRHDLWFNPQGALATLKRDPELALTVSNDHETPLHIAVQGGNVTLVRWLMKAGIDVNARSYNEFTALHLARNGKVAALLLAKGARSDMKDTFDRYPLHAAASDVLFGDDDRAGVVEVILESGVKLDLVTAICMGRHEQARELIVAGEGLYQEIDGNTPLHLAARAGDIETAGLLLRAGLNVNCGDQVGMNFGGKHTPLWEALIAHRTKMVVFLCSNGANPILMGRQYEMAILPKAEYRDILIFFGNLHMSLAKMKAFISPV